MISVFLSVTICLAFHNAFTPLCNAEKMFPAKSSNREEWQSGIFRYRFGAIRSPAFSSVIRAPLLHYQKKTDIPAFPDW
jgi:hypothetical protein